MGPMLAFLLEHMNVIGQVISVINKGIEMAPELAERARKQSSLLAVMIAENRAPTQAEMDELTATIEEARAVLHATDDAQPDMLTET